MTTNAQRPAASTRRPREFGDFQTPAALAERVCDVLVRQGQAPATVLEPTCGRGAFLVAAKRAWPSAHLRGTEIDRDYAEAAMRAVPSAVVQRADVFRVDWPAELATLAEPILLLGNPPWVTNAAIGRDGGRNLPDKRNDDAAAGFDALTGRSNFDVSEWMIRHFAEHLADRRASIAMLVKTAVARRVIRWLARQAIAAHTDTFAIDAKKHFDASVDAGLFVIRFGGASSESEHRVFASLDERIPIRTIAHVDDELVADRETYVRLRHLVAAEPVRWRSGVKHDCASVMELRPTDGGWENARSERVAIEDDALYPTVNATDVARARPATRRMIVTQHAIGDDPAERLDALPRTRAYLDEHADALAARKSRIYHGRPPYSIFGIGDYTFAPWKVAISGLHDDLVFRVLGPVDGKPVVPNDTVYFLGFDRARDAERVAAFLNAPDAQAFYRALIFPESKRPVTAKLLGRLSLEECRIPRTSG